MQQTSSDNLKKIYDKSVEKLGLTSTYDEFVDYWDQSDDNKRKVYDKAVSDLGLTSTYDEFLSYAGSSSQPKSNEQPKQQQQPKVTTQSAAQPTQPVQQQRTDTPYIAMDEPMAVDEVPEQYRAKYATLSPAEQRVVSKAMRQKEQMSTQEGRQKAAQDKRAVASNLDRKNPKRKQLLEEAEALEYADKPLLNADQMTKLNEEDSDIPKTVEVGDTGMTVDNPEVTRRKKEKQRMKDEQYLAIDGKVLEMGGKTSGYTKGSDIVGTATKVYDNTDDGKIMTAKIENAIQLDQQDFMGMASKSDDKDIAAVAQFYQKYSALEQEGNAIGALSQRLTEMGKTLDPTNEAAVNAYNAEVAKAQKRYDAYTKEFEEYKRLQESGAVDKYNEAFSQYLYEGESATRPLLQEKNDAINAMFGDWIDRKSIPLKKKVAKDFTDKLVSEYMAKRKELEEGGNYIPGYMLNSPMGSPLGMSGRTTNSSASATAEQYIKKAQDLINNDRQSIYANSLVKGAADVVTDMDFWTFGMNEAVRGYISLDIMKKVQRGADQLNEEERRAYDAAVEKERNKQPLTDAEEAAMEKAAALGRENLTDDEKLAYDAMQNYWQVQQLFNTSGWYMAGQTTAEAIPFIVAMWGSGGILDALKGGAKGAEKVAMRQLGKQAEKLTLKKAVGNTLKAVGNMGAEGAVYATTTGLPHTVAGTMEYLMPESKAYYDTEDGTLKVQGVMKSEESVASAIGKAWYDQFVEGMSEAFSTYGLEPLQAAAYARLAGSTATKLGKEGNRAYKDIVRAAFKKGSTGDAMFRNISSFPNEYIEEIFGGFMRCIGRTSEWDKEFSGETLAQTAYGLLPMQVVFGGMGAVRMHKHNQRMKEAQNFLDEYAPDKKDLYERLSMMSTYEGQDLLDREILSIQQEIDALKAADKFDANAQKKVAAEMNMALVMKEQLYMDEYAATIKDERSRNAFEVATSNLNEDTGDLITVEYTDNDGNTKQGYLISQDGEEMVVSDGKKNYKTKASNIKVTNQYSQEDIEDGLFTDAVEPIAQGAPNAIAGEDYTDADGNTLVFEGGGTLHIDNVDENGDVTFTINGQQNTVSRRQFREMVQQSRNNMDNARADVKTSTKIGSGVERVAANVDDPAVSSELGRAGRNARADLAEAVGEERTQQFENMDEEELARAYAQADADTKLLMQDWMKLGGRNNHAAYHEQINERINAANNATHKMMAQFVRDTASNRAKKDFSRQDTVTMGTLDDGTQVVVGANQGGQATVMDMAGNRQLIPSSRLTETHPMSAMGVARATNQGFANQMRALERAFNGTAFQVDTEHTIGVDDNGKEDKAVVVGITNRVMEDGSVVPYVAYATEYAPNDEGGFKIANRSVNEVTEEEFRDMVEGAQRKQRGQQDQKQMQAEADANQGRLTEGQEVTVMVNGKPVVGQYVNNVGHHLVVDSEGKTHEFKSIDELKESMQQAKVAMSSAQDQQRKAEVVEQSELEKKYQAEFEQAKTEKDKADVIQRYLNEIKTEDFTMLTDSNFEEEMRKAGAKPEDIADFKKALAITRLTRQRVRGFNLQVGGIFIHSNDITSIEDARTTYVHERQHTITRNNVSLQQQVLANATEEELKRYVKALSYGSTFYDDKSADVVAEEFLSMAMEIAYMSNDVATALRDFGIDNEELINTIIQLDNGQRTEGRLSSARRGQLGNESGQRDNRNDVGNPQGESEQMGEPRPRPAGGSQQETGQNLKDTITTPNGTTISVGDEVEFDWPKGTRDTGFVTGITPNGGINIHFNRGGATQLSPEEADEYNLVVTNSEDNGVRPSITAENPLDKFIAKHGDNAENKLNKTIEAINKEIANLESKLVEEQRIIDDMPEPFNEETQKAFDKQTKLVEKVGKDLEAARKALAPYTAMREELDARQEAANAVYKIETESVWSNDENLTPEAKQLLTSVDLAMDGAPEEASTSEIRYSYTREPVMRGKSQLFFDRAKGGLTFNEDTFDVCNATIQTMVDIFNEHANDEFDGVRLLPPDDVIKGQNTIFNNGSYGRTMENTTKCLRTLAYDDFVDAVKENLGRPLSTGESFLVSQMLYDIAVDPQCLYCYVSLDRKAYDEFLLRYIQQRDAVIEEYRASGIDKRLRLKPQTAKKGERKGTLGDSPLEQLYSRYLDGREDSPDQRRRFNMWIANADKGLATSDMLATEASRNAAIEQGGEIEKQIRDAQRYAQAASWAKVSADYRAYNGEILRLGQGIIDKLKQEYGLRFYSFSEYSPAFIVENMQMIRDAALRGLNGLAYTKEVDFARIFAPSGININISCFGRKADDGTIVMDTKQGADWNEVQDVKKQYPNVGAVFVATDDEQTEWALNQPWIDVVIPFHIMRTGGEVADFYGWINHTAMQADVDTRGHSRDVMPTEHHNDKERFLELCKERGLKPRFADMKLSNGESVTTHPNYMKLVNETRLSIDETVPIHPIFDLQAAKDSFANFVEKGGYYGGWWAVDSEGVKDAVKKVADDIRAGKNANEVEYGRQNIPFRPEVLTRLARKARASKAHGNIPLHAGELGIGESKTMYSITAEQDNAYMDAVQSGDMETAQRMVMEAAKAAMPNTKVVDENGNPLVVYHGRSAEFNTFERTKGVRFVMGLEDEVVSEGFFFTPNKDFAEEYAANSSRHRGGRQNTVSAFLNIQNPLDLAFNDNFARLYEEVTGYEYMLGMDEVINLWEIMDIEGMADKIKSKGYDGVIFAEEQNEDGSIAEYSYCVFDPNQIKSADPVTYDDQGNVIPLSERFNPNNNDIRYSIVNKQGELNYEELDNIIRGQRNELAGLSRIPEEAVGRAVATPAIAAEAIARGVRQANLAEVWGEDKAREHTRELIKQWAKQSGHWYDEARLTEDATEGRGGTESRVFVTNDRKTVRKLTSPVFSQGNIEPYIESLHLFGNVFGESAYDIKGFGENEKGELCVVVEQPYIQGVRLSDSGITKSLDKIREFMESLGFKEYGVSMFENDKFRIEDVNRTNVIVDENGDFHVIDAFVELADESLYKEEPMYSFIGKQGAERMDVKEGAMNRINSLEDAKKLEELLGTDEEAARKIKLATGWERGKDGKWRYEIADNAYTYNATKTSGKLDEFISHEELFKAYPEFKDMNVKIGGLADNLNGYYSKDDNTIYLTNKITADEQKSTLIHEIQHAIQSKEGFAKGGNSKRMKQAIKDMSNNSKIWAYKLMLDVVAEDGNYSNDQESMDAMLDDIVKTGGYNTVEEAEADEFIPNEDMRKLGFKIWSGKVKGEQYKKAFDKWVDTFGDLLNDYVIERAKQGEINGSKAEEEFYDMIGYELYKAIAGEVEARNTQTRMGMTYQERLEQLAKDTEDVAREDQLIMLAGDPVLYSVTANEDADMGKPSLKEITTEYLLTLAEQNQEDMQALADATKAYNDLISDANKRLKEAARAGQEYGKQRADEIRRLAVMLMRHGRMNDMTRGEVSRLLSAMKNAVDSNLINQAEKVIDILVDHQLKAEEALWNKQLKTKGVKLNDSRVRTQGALGIQAQQILAAVNEGIKLSDKAFDDMFADVESQLDDLTDSRKRREAEAKYQGLLIAKKFLDDIRDSKENVAEAKKKMRERLEEIYNFDDEGNRTLKPEFKGHLDEEHKAKKKEVMQFEKEQLRTIREEKMRRADNFAILNAMLGGAIRDGRIEAKEFLERRLQRINDIHHNANSDQLGQNDEEHYEHTPWEKFKGNALFTFAFSPQRNFDEMLRFFAPLSVDGRGYLHRRFMSQYSHARDTEWRGLQRDNEILDAKAKEILGDKKVSKWRNLYAVERRMPKIEVEFYDGTEKDEEGNTVRKKKNHTLTQGQALYIYMTNKQSAGAARLRAMGISEEDVQRIVEQIDPQFIQLADWIQDEFLPQLRERYNEVHERVFGTPLAKNENYFPLRTNAKSRNRKVDLGNENLNDVPSTVTGAIIERQNTIAALDLTHADAFSIVIEHIQEMEHWAAFAEFNSDLQALLNYKRFRTRVENMSSVRFGYGEELFKRFEETAKIAAGTYKPKRDDNNKAAVNVAKGMTASKINFRFYTALKQMSSHPAFWADANITELAKLGFNPAGIVTSVKWAMKELPGFAKRWESRQAGNEMLDESKDDWAIWRSNVLQGVSRVGMFSNAGMDAITVAIGAKAVYETKFGQYKKQGYDEAKAKEMALQDASMVYNESQQSQDPAYLSAMQSQRDWLNSGLAMFRNASFGYGRRYYRAITQLKKGIVYLANDEKKKQAIEYATKMGVREGLTEQQAYAAAKKAVNNMALKNLWDVAIYGYIVQFFWNLMPYIPYLVGGDDDDKKEEMLKNIALHSLAGPIEGMPLGNIVSSAFDNYLWHGKDWASYDYNLIPLIADINRVRKAFKNDELAAANDVLNIIIASGIGFDIKGITDGFIAVMDAVNGDPETTIETALLLMRIAEVPQSQLDQLYIDEVGLTGAEASRMPLDALARRLAHYKMKKNNPLLWRLYSDEKREQVEQKYINRIMKEMQNRINSIDDDELENFFNEETDPDIKKMIGKRVAEEYGVKDDESRKPSKTESEESAKSKIVYQKKRTIDDARQDFAIRRARQEAEEAGDTERYKAIDKEWRAIQKLRKDLNGGESDEAVLEQMREAKKAVIEYYNITTQQ